MSLKKWARKYLAWINVDEWRMRLLGLSYAAEENAGRGLVLIQIDGFSFHDCQRAIQKGHMPFLRRLMRREHYVLRDMYSGIPSNTPAFQGEFFFGKSQCVPSFQFLNRKDGKVHTMYEKISAETVETHLKEKDQGLLAGGTAYGNIFSGGAKESHICASTADWMGVLKTWNPYSLLITLLLTPFAIIRGVFLCIVEAVLSFIDCLRVAGRKDFVNEFSFILMRVFVSILMREIITAHARMDVYRGTRVIHVNYFGYDEQAHRRGPSTRFAYWSLSGIDSAIKKIWKSVHRAEKRHYDFWVYSDHGQETVKPFSVVAKKSIQQAVQDLYDEMGAANPSSSFKHSVQAHGGGLSGDTVMSQRFRNIEKKAEDAQNPTVTTLGPISHIYFPQKYSNDEKRIFAKRLLEKNPLIPIIMIPLENGEIECETKTGRHSFPADAEKILGPKHPYLEAATKDLKSFFEIENRGDLVIFGWSYGAEAVSFSSESGAHAGFGPHETQAFILVPPDAPVEKNPEVIIRGQDLRKAALTILGRARRDRRVHRSEVKQERRKFRVMSYNVHSCTGMDGILSVERIARVIAKSDPDVVALQELDAGRRIQGGDQAAAIAKELEMNFHFHPVCGADKQCFGNAVLSSHPMRFVKTEHLPALKRPKFLEPRGILWVEVDFYGHKVQILNTHLSLWTSEMQIQVEKILGADVLGNPDLKGEIILCGDFNMTPGSRFYKQLTQHFKQPVFHGSKISSNTWTSQWPIRKLDHILMRGNFQGERVVIPRTRLESYASDHLPIVADFHF